MFNSSVQGHKIGRFVSPEMVSQESFPGFPFNKDYRSYEQFVRKDQKHYYELLWSVHNGTIYVHDYPPLNTHIKNEPTKISKLIDFKARNIAAPVATERMAECACYSDFNDRIKASKAFTPIQCELNKWNGGYAELYSRAQEKLRQLFLFYDNRDYPQWDRGFPEEIRDIIHEYFLETAGPTSSFWLEFEQWVYSKQSNHKLMDMLGHVWFKENGMHSGGFNTSVWNSIGHVLLRLFEFRAQYPELADDWEAFLQFYVGGDDYTGISTVEPPSDEFLKEFYGKFGMLTDPDKRDVSNTVDGMKFLGCRLKVVGFSNHFVLESPRALANLLYCQRDDDDMAAAIDALLAECWYDDKVRPMLLELQGLVTPKQYTYRPLFDIWAQHVICECGRSPLHPGQTEMAKKGKSKKPGPSKAGMKAAVVAAAGNMLKNKNFGIMNKKSRAPRKRRNGMVETSTNAPVNTSRGLQKTGQGASRSQIVSGSDLIETVGLKGGTDSNALGALLINIPLNPRTMTLTRVQKLSQMFQRYKVKKFIATLIPTLPTTSGGNVVAFFNTDVTKLPVSAGIGGVNSALAHQGAKSDSVWKEIVVVLPADNRTYQLNFGEGDPREQFFAYFGVMVSSAITATGLEPGSTIYNLRVDYTFEFIDPTLDLAQGENFQATLYNLSGAASSSNQIFTCSPPMNYQIGLARISSAATTDAPVGASFFMCTDQTNQAFSATQGQVVLFDDFTSAWQYTNNSTSIDNALKVTFPATVVPFVIEVYGMTTKTVAQAAADGATEQRIKDEGDIIELVNPTYETTTSVFQDNRSILQADEESGAGTGNFRSILEGTSADNNTTMTILDSSSNPVYGGSEVVIVPTSSALLAKWGIKTRLYQDPGTNSIVLGLFSVFTLLGKLCHIVKSIASTSRLCLREVRRLNEADPVIANYQPSAQELESITFHYYRRLSEMDQCWKYVLYPALEQSMRAGILELVGEYPCQFLEITAAHRRLVGIPDRPRPLLDSTGRVQKQSAKTNIHTQLAAILGQLDESDVRALVELMGSNAPVIVPKPQGPGRLTLPKI